MDYITNNASVIVPWYHKQLAKENLTVPPLRHSGDVWCGLPPKSVIKTVEANLGYDDAVLIKIVPLLKRNLCHYNVKIMLKILNKKEKKYTGVLGFNIMGCDCGKTFNLEIHSVLECNGEYIDLTEDYGGCPQKWFIPVFEWDEEDYDVVKYIIYSLKQAKQDCPQFGHKHSCRQGIRIVTWLPPNNVGDYDLINDIIHST